MSQALIVMLGAPGSGKGTQAVQLAEQLGIPHISSGDLLRAHRERGTDLGQRAQSAMDLGDLVPDELVTAMVMERLAEPDAAGGAVLDGFPRTVRQAEALDRALADHDATLSAIFLDVPSAALVERLAGRRTCPACQASYHVGATPPAEADRCDRCGAALVQRSDDRADVVQHRVAVYLQQTQPVVEHYAQLGLLRRVDGDRPVELIMAELQRMLRAPGTTLATSSGVGLTVR
jgi:adenylate kinase